MFVTLASELSCSCLIFNSGGCRWSSFVRYVDFGLSLILGHSLSGESRSKMAQNQRVAGNGSGASHNYTLQSHVTRCHTCTNFRRRDNATRKSVIFDRFAASAPLQR